MENGNIANQIHGFTIDYGKSILKLDGNSVHVFYFLNNVYLCKNCPLIFDWKISLPETPVIERLY